MKKALTINILCMMVALTLQSCGKDDPSVPTGRVVAEEYSFSGSLSNIEVSDGIRLVITPEIPEKTVRVVTNEDVQQYVIVQQRQGALNLFIDRQEIPFDEAEVAIYVSENNFDTFAAHGGSIISSIGTIGSLNVDVTVDGGSQVDADFDCKSMILNLSEMSIFNGSVMAEDLYAGLEGMSKAEMSGLVDYFELECTGSSNLSGFALSCATLEVSESGGSLVEITVTGLLQGEVSGGSKLYYKGNPPRIILDKTGASIVDSVE